MASAASELVDRPIAVIVDCCHKSYSEECADCDRLLYEILGGGDKQDCLPTKLTCSNDVLDLYPLHLETKYYSAEVGVCTLRSPTIGDKEFAGSVESVIFWVSTCGRDDLDPSIITSIDQWLSYIQHWEQTAVKLLVCKRAASGSSLKQSLQEWCIKNDFELAELDPDEEAASEAQECAEPIGVKRILQALQSHSWSNLVIKDERKLDADRAKRLHNYLQEDEEKYLDASANSGPKDSSPIERPNDDAASSIDHMTSNQQSGIPSSKLNSQIDQLLDETSAVGIEGNGSFEELFSKFSAMKTTADSLPPEDRKKYAEKVTVAFWRAIGGDDSEIVDSDDDGNLDS